MLPFFLPPFVSALVLRTFVLRCASVRAEHRERYNFGNFSDVAKCERKAGPRDRVSIVDERSKRGAREEEIYDFTEIIPGSSSLLVTLSATSLTKRASERADKRGNANCDTNVRSRRSILHVNGRDGVQGRDRAKIGP